MKYLITFCAIVLLLSGCYAQAASTEQVDSPTPTIAPLTGISVPVVQVNTPIPTSLIANLPIVVKAVPATPTPTLEPWRFVVLGDTRTGGLDPPEELTQIVELARVHQPALTLAMGDLIYAESDKARVREQWRRWRAAIAPLGATANSPWMLVTPGNHDVQDNAWATDLMAEAFPELPDNGPAGLKRLAYRYDYQGVRFISIHTEIFDNPKRLGDAQMAWLEDQLKNNPNRYTIVYGHDPAYPIGPHRGSSLDTYKAERDAFWALLKQYHVTAYLCGHEHLYNRQTINGVTQLVIGTSGSFPYAGFGGDFYHYALAEVRSDGIHVNIYDNHNTERDQFVLQ